MSLKDLLSPDLHDVADQFTSADELARSYKATKSKIGGMVTVPKDEESRRNMLKRMGAYETVDSYELPAESAANLESLRSAAHQASLTGDQWRAVAPEVSKILQAQKEAAEKAAADRLKEYENLTREKFGDSLDEVRGYAAKGLETLSTDNADLARVLQEGNADSHPSVIQALASIGKMKDPVLTNLNSSAPTSGAAGLRDEIKALLDTDAMKSDGRHPDFKRFQKQIHEKDMAIRELGFTGYTDKSIDM